MITAVGIGLIAVAATVGLVGALVLWPRLPAAVVVPLIGGCGAAVGAGGLLVQEAVGPADWIVATVTLAVLAPVHCRVLFGRPGRIADRRVVAEGPGAA